MLHKAIWVINYEWTVFDDWLKWSVLCKRYGLENKPKAMQEIGDWVSGMLVAWGALLCESMVWTLWGQCQSQAGRTWRTDGTTKRLGKPLLISAWGSAGTFRPVECVYTCVCVCVCVLKACSRVVWDAKDDTCVSAGRVCVVTVSEAGIGPLLCWPSSLSPSLRFSSFSSGAAALSPVSFWGSEWLAFEEYSGGLSGMFCVTL